MSSLPLRVAYFGLPLGALALHQAGVSPCVIALGHPDAPGARRVRRTFAHGTLVLARPDLTSTEVLRAISSARPDVILSWFWPFLIPQDVLDLAPRGAFGVHPSLLPRWRGPDPYFWALFRGDAYSGVTLHRLAREYDTGDIVAQHRIAIAPALNAWTLAKRLDSPSLRLFVEAAQQLGRGEPLAGVAQEEGTASAAPSPDDELQTLRWQAEASEIVNLVRALAPHPGAATTLGSEPVEVLSAVVYDGRVPRVLEVGDAVMATQGVVIRAGEGAVLIRRVRRENGQQLSGVEVGQLFAGGLFKLPW
ncbi:MAG: methionyl-tRNA formyltransferase [Myxococcales bacterium]